MPRAKRPLEEADPNAQTSPPKSSKRSDTRKRSLRSSGPVSDEKDAEVSKDKNLKATKGKSSGKSVASSNSKSGNTPSDKESTGKNPSTEQNSTSSKNDTTLTKESDNTPPSRSTSTTAKGSKSSTAKDKSDSKPNSSAQGDVTGHSKDKPAADVDWDNTPVDKLPAYEYVIGQPPAWDWDDANRVDGSFTPDESDNAYDRMLSDLQPYMFKPLDRKPNGYDHKWPIMHGAMVRYVDAIYASNKRNDELLGMSVYNDFQGYGLHEVVENLLVDYRKEFVKKEADRNIKELWVIATGFIYFAKMHEPMNDLFGHVDDGDRVFSILDLIGVTFLSVLDLLEKADQLRPDSDFKDLALVMKMYILWAEEWDSDTFDGTTQEWDAKILKYARDHKIDLSGDPPTKAAETVAEVEQRASKDKDQKWPKPGPDRWGFKKAFDKHGRDFGKGGHEFDITKMSKAERIQYSLDNKDPFADIPAKALKEGKIDIGTL